MQRQQGAHAVEKAREGLLAQQQERKQRVLTQNAAAIARSIADAVVIKDADIFFLTEPDGSVPMDEGHGFGLYYDFWLKEPGMYALGLQAGNLPIAVVSSNPGHALWAGIADDDKARQTMERLMADDMFNGWGIRTLSSNERRYNPVGYHLGTVWPHDNALIAAGFRRYGFADAARRLFAAIVEAATYFEHERLPELFAGFGREEYGVPVRYPVACHPQAWAAGSVPYLLTTLLGLAPEALDRKLRIIRPVLPRFVEHIEIQGLRVGDARVDLRFEHVSGHGVTVEVLRVDGRLDVLVENEAFDQGRF